MYALPITERIQYRPGPQLHYVCAETCVGRRLTVSVTDFGHTYDKPFPFHSPSRECLPRELIDVNQLYEL